MYCVKVEPGTEKTRVRNYAGAFLPSYSPAVRYAVSAGKRSLIVPGYVFTLSPVGKSVLVPEEEWRIIDALSDPSLSSVNSEGVIWDGPLKGLIAASVDEKYGGSPRGIPELLDPGENCGARGGSGCRRGSIRRRRSPRRAGRRSRRGSDPGGGRDSGRHRAREYRARREKRKGDTENVKAGIHAGTD